jgi:integrase/recombinase XerD
MKTVPYTSVLAEYLADYIALRRNLGYELRTQVYTFAQFDRVAAQEMSCPGPVTRQVVEAFLRSLDGLKPTTRRVRLSTVRQFLIYLRQLEPETFVPDRFLEPARSSPRAPHIYTDAEILALLREALLFPFRFPTRRWLLYHSLFAFLYATGMRISEALALTLADVDLRRELVYIRKTKFHKARLVPFLHSTSKALQRYLIARAERGYPTTPDAPLFVNREGRFLSSSTVRNAFHEIAGRAGLRCRNEARQPRIHDLRHTAAVRRLYLWYREGKDVQALLPALVTYLGHSAVRCTQIYLTTTAELLGEANTRFERYFDLDCEAPGGAES